MSQPFFTPDLPGTKVICLLLAAGCLLLALRFMRQALAPVGPIVRALVAAVIVTAAIGAGLIFVTAAAVFGH